MAVMVRERRNDSALGECYAIWTSLALAMKAALISRYIMAGEACPPKRKVPSSTYETVISKLRW